MRSQDWLRRLATERTREIGLRMAVGASRQAVLEQFLTESIVISMAGGIIGILVGIAIPSVAPLSHVPISVTSVFVAFGVSVAVGSTRLLLGFDIAARRRVLKLWLQWWVGVLGQQVGFEEWDAVEAPGGVGDFVAQLRLGGDGGLLLVEKLLDVALVGFGVLGGQDGRVGSETMAQRVERRTLLARFDARTGRVLGVGAVGGGATFQPALDGVRCCGGCWSLGCCCHFVHLGHRNSTGGGGVEGWAGIVC